MSTATELQIPAGTYSVDQTHSNANFEVEHAGVSVFRGGFKPIDGRLVSGDEGLALEGGVSVESISIDDENLRPHLLSPDFFDVERNPEVRFASTEITGAPDELKVAGELSMAGISLPVEATGRLRGPVTGPAGNPVLALSLETMIDRTAFGMVWQMDLPDGNKALANEVKLVVELELVKD
jgi:polyisoprenoid-binding protein YceI